VLDAEERAELERLRREITELHLGGLRVFGKLRALFVAEHNR
jgi:hypothetical protein